MADRSAAPPSSATLVSQPLWDLPVRVVHALFIVCVAFAWISYELDLMDWHVRNGLLMVGLVVFRLLWGLVGSTSARFSHFLAGPGAVIAYLKAWRTPQARRWAGHNPLGGWAVLAMLLLLAAQATTGLFATDDILTDGPLRSLVETGTAQALTEWHELIYFWGLLVLIGIHVAAVVAYRLAKGWDLVTPMITGHAPLEPGATRDLRSGFWGRLLACVALSAGVVWLIVQWGEGTF